MVWLKARIVEQTNEAIARQRRSKHITAATDTDATTEDICSPCQGYIMRTNWTTLSVRGWSQQLPVLSWTVSTHYLAMSNNENKSLSIQTLCLVTNT
jgi:hypothetical protein